MFLCESVAMCLCEFIVHLTGLEKASVRCSVWFPLRPSGEDRSLLETDLVCMNHSVGVCMCVILCVYIHTSDFARACFLPGHRFIPLPHIFHLIFIFSLHFFFPHQQASFYPKTS